MFTALNILLVLLALFIAYWWANQGLFSSLLHLVCVIIAGALALALWEPVTTGLLLRGTGFDDYAWGISLVLLFIVFLFIFRIASDKLVPANVRVPRWADLGFGGLFGACAAVLTMGFLIIGCGFVQSTNNIMGYQGASRTATTGRVEDARQELWVPFHKMTSEFYGLLSVTSFSPVIGGKPLRHVYPDLYQQATLIRDTYRDGRGQLSLRPADASVTGFYRCRENPNRFAVAMHFDNGARDFGEQLTLSASQIRLISSPGGSAPAQTLHPHSWTQWSGFHMFDSSEHYITSQPGQQTVDVTIFFDTTPDFTPRFIQIRGVRYALPAPVDESCGILAQGVIASEESLAQCQSFAGAPSIDQALSVDNSTRSIIVSVNVRPATIEHDDKTMTFEEGFADFEGGTGGLPSSGLRITGLHEPEGTRVVKLDVSRDSVASYFDVMSQVGEDASLALVDAQGKPYWPIGYMHKQGQTTHMVLRPSRPFRTIEGIPILPTAGDDTLELIFHITEGMTIQGFCFAGQPIGSANVTVTPQER